jgi:hypothetical protein
MPAWWNSPDALALWLTRATVAGILFAVLAAVSGAVTLALRNRRDQLLAIPTRLTAIEEDRRPYRLTPQQHAALVAAMQPFVGSKLTMDAKNDPGALSMARSIEGALRDARIDAYFTTGFSSEGEGFAIYVRDTQTAPEFTGVLQRTLESFGFEVPAVTDPKKAAGSLTLVIGRRKSLVDAQ